MILDKFINTNNQHPSDQGRQPISFSLNMGLNGTVVIAMNWRNKKSH
jgi:hypothetical protein